MRVLLVNTFHYMRGGDSRHVFGLARLLKSSGWSVSHFAMKGGRNVPCESEAHFIDEIDYAQLLGGRRYLGAAKVLWKSIYSSEARAKISRLLDEKKPDIVHIHSIRHHITTSVIFEIAKRTIPIAWTLHDYKEICPNTTFHDGKGICERCRGGNYSQVIVNRCKRGSLAASAATYLETKVNSLLKYDRHIGVYIAPSAFLRKKFIEYGYAQDRVAHLPNFLELGEFTPQYSYGDYILFLGRLETSKGLGTLIRAFTRIGAERPHLRLKIAGTGGMDRELRSTISTTRLNNVEMLGFVEGEQLLATMRNAMAVVVPSEWYENYPFSVLEAMAFGKPVIASRIGGIPEQVEDGVTGYLVDPASADDLAEKIKLLSSQPEQTLIRMGMAAREKVEKVNSPDTYLENLIKIYKQLLSVR
ncbi:MAG: glycosyltransferase [Desulfobacteraceae bacterium]|nr:glycosyltransferase [Desulfobacteraceae bacterium]